MKSEKGIHGLLIPFSGCLELGMVDDAVDVLEGLPNELMQHPLVLSARLDILVTKKRWDDGVILAQSLCGLWPTHLAFWFQAAFCLHELRRTSEAKQALLDAPRAIRETVQFAYNMACYEAQLGNISRAKELVAGCIKEAPQMKATALDDPDLAPMWASFDCPM